MAVIDERQTRDGEARYRARVRIKGRPQIVRTFKRKTDARRWAQAIEVDLRRGMDLPQNEARRRTLAELIDHYLEEFLSSLSEEERRKRSLQLRWWYKELGPYHLADLRPSLIADARNRLARCGPSGRALAPGTQNRYLAALSAVISYGVRELEWLEDNPVRRVRRQREPRGRIRFLGDDERERLLEACRESRDRRLFPLAVTAIYTGMRQGELLRLRWDDVNLDDGMAIIHESKNGDRRAVPIAGPALEAIREFNRVRYLHTDLIFATRRGRTTFPRKAWEDALAQASIEDFTFHDCRHTAASYLAQSGARLHEIAEVLGHRTLQMVQRYAHLTDQHTAAVVRRMAEQFSS